MCTIKSAFRKAFDEMTYGTTADEIIKTAEELVDPICKEDLLSVACALNYSPIFAATNELVPDRDFFMNASTLELIYSMILNQIGFGPSKALEILDVLKYAKHFSCDVSVRETNPSEKLMISEIQDKRDSEEITDKKDIINSGSERKSKPQKKDTLNIHKKRRNKELLKEMESLYHTAFIKLLYLGSYVVLFMFWSLSFIIILLRKDWQLALVEGLISSLLTVAASQIIPLIKQSYERSMMLPELSCFILEIKGENPKEYIKSEFEFPEFYKQKNGL
jgi:hypothetical protein